MTADDQWHKLCALEDLNDGAKVGKQIRGASLLIVRMSDDVFCYEDRCPHAGAPLADGKLSQSLLTCRHHQWQFDLRTGKSIRPKGRDLKAFAVKIEDGEVFVSL